MLQMKSINDLGRGRKGGGGGSGEGGTYINGPWVFQVDGKGDNSTIKREHKLVVHHCACSAICQTSLWKYQYWVSICVKREKRRKEESRKGS